MNQEKAKEFFSAYYEGTLEAGLQQSLEQQLRADGNLRREFRDFERAMEDVLAAKQVMQQSLFEDRHPMLPGADPRWRTLALASMGIAVLALAIALVALFGVR